MGNVSNIEMVLFGAVIVFLIAITFALAFLVRTTTRANKLSYPIYEYIVKQAEHKAQKITYDAMKQSRELLVDAELKGTRVIAKGALEHKHIEEVYEQKLSELVSKSEALFEGIVQKAEQYAEKTNAALEQHANAAAQNVASTNEHLQQYSHQTEERLKEMAATLERSLSEDLAQNEDTLKESATAIAHHMEESVKEIEGDFRQQISVNLSKEFEAAKSVIDTYRTQQIAFIDSYIVALVERTTAIALQKKLSLGDHAELVEHALEAAKSEGIFK